MLKKILGQAPFDAALDGDVIITPGKKRTVTLLLSNISEYDLPLSCSLNLSVSADVDKAEFDVIVPAEGKTEVCLTFSKDVYSRMFTGCGIAELEIVDRIFDSKTLYEFEICCEAAYKCTDKNDGFLPTEEIFFTNEGRFFANKGERVCVEIPLMESTQYRLCILSGKIKDLNDGDIIKLSSGLNRLAFEMTGDGSFELRNADSDRTVYPDTVCTKYFI